MMKKKMAAKGMMMSEKDMYGMMGAGGKKPKAKAKGKKKK